MKINTSYFAQYGNTTLHTNYNYFRPNLFLKSVQEGMQALSMIQGDIDTLEAKELQFYKKFGKNSYEEFIFFLRQIMQSQDGVYLRRASNENIRKFLLSEIKRRTDSDLTQVEVDIVVNTEDVAKKLKNINQLIIGSISQKGKTSTGAEVFRVSGNIQTMKQIFNRIASKNLNPRSINPDALSKLLSEKELSKLIDIQVGGQSKSMTEFGQMIKFRPYPWGYTNAELKQALQSNNEYVKQELNKAVTDIRQAVYNYFGGGVGSTQYVRALETTLKTVLPEGGYNIFLIGANVENGLIGAFGEFGTALLIQYLYQLTGTQISESVAEVVGQSLGKQDVRIFDQFGIQVKNYSIEQSKTGAYTRRAIDVKQHPSELVGKEGLDGYFTGDTNSFTGFLANFFFNGDIQRKYFSTIYDLEEALRSDYTAQLLRFAVADIGDTICFYNISQQFFVPASRILRFYREQAESLRVHISGESGEKWQEGPSIGPNEYWEKIDGRWAPTKSNINLFNAYVDKLITIKATMTRLNIGSYSY